MKISVETRKKNVTKNSEKLRNHLGN